MTLAEIKVCDTLPKHREGEYKGCGVWAPGILRARGQAIILGGCYQHLEEKAAVVGGVTTGAGPVSYTHLRAHET